MNELQIFKNSKFGEIRIIREGDKVLFCGADITKALGYVKTSDAINRHCKGAVKRGTPTASGIQEMLFIPVGDIYRLAAKSHLEGADEFEHWIFDEVIPAVLLTGSYSMQKKPMTELEILAASTQALVDHERQLKAHEDQLAAIEAHQDDADKRLDTVEKKIVKAAEAFSAPSFHPDTWQKDTNESINQIVQANGLNHQKYRESLYSRLESIAGVNLRKRQTRAKTRMSEAGATKTQLAEVSKLSIVARDKKLRVIFDGILREERAHNIVVA